MKSVDDKNMKEEEVIVVFGCEFYVGVCVMWKLLVKLFNYLLNILYL